jgi:hypothetical protein
MSNNPLIDYIINIIISKTGLEYDDFFKRKTDRDKTMYVYLAIGLTYEYFGNSKKSIYKVLSVHDIGNYFNKTHALVSYAKRKSSDWVEIYVDYRIIKKFVEIKINEKYCYYHKLAL